MDTPFPITDIQVTAAIMSVAALIMAALAFGWAANRMHVRRIERRVRELEQIVLARKAERDLLTREMNAVERRAVH